MQWISHYQLFLFDFDGLLVNTERMHHQAYINMCAKRGFQLNWDFTRYSAAAHHHSSDLRDQIYAEFPQLYAIEPHWHVLYEEKKQEFLNLIEQGAVPHSPTSLIEQIRKQNPILNTIPHWITRENYSEPKPSPECYQFAIASFAKPGDRIIGFEDSPRGLNALLGTKAKPVLICPPNSSYLEELLKNRRVTYFPSFEAIQSMDNPL